MMRLLCAALNAVSRWHLRWQARRATHDRRLRATAQARLRAERRRLP